MLDASMTSHVRAAANRFAGANQGNIAVIFAIALVPLISFVGAAIDYSRANAARSSMQAALDSTALMLSKELSQGVVSPDQITAKAQAYFNALYTNKDAKAVQISATYTASTTKGSTIEINGSGNVAADFMQLAGFPTLGFNTSSTSAWGNVRMRVAMALDNTGSMAQSGKMSALQTAVAGKDGIIDQLSALSKNDGDIYISIIPFAKDVNFSKDAAGNSNVNQPWIDWSLWDAANGTCSNTSYTTKSTCLANNNRTWTPKNHSNWTGCFTDRTQDYDTTNTTPVSSATLFPAEEYVSGSAKYCKVGNNPYLQPIMPLTNNWSSLKTLTTNMQPTGNTNQGIGLAWAWMTLGQGAPFNAPTKDPNYTYKDAIILLSDGLNTQNRYSSTASQIDARQALLCTNAKGAGITIYTVQVNTGGDATSTVLKNCATGPSDFYLITDPNQTLSVFNSIGTSLAKLRVAK